MHLRTLHKLLFLIVIVVLSGMSSIVFCQSTEEWSLPFSITDSLTDNHNPGIVTYDEGYRSAGMVFWERVINDSTTAIWMRNLTYMTPEEEVFHIEGAHFRNLHFQSMSGTPYPPDTLIYIFFESNMNGDYDIFLSKYYEGGGFTAPVMIIGGEGDQMSMDWSGYHICWQADGKIKVAEYMGGNSFTDPIVIDSLNCMNPCLSDGRIAYEKIINDSSKVYYSSSDYTTGWSEPENLFDQGHNTSLSFVSSNPPYSYGDLIWENNDGLEWTIFGASYDLEIEEMEISNSEQMNPKALQFDIPIVNEIYLWISYLTYNYQEGNTSEIYANSDWGAYQSAYPISNSPEAEINPIIGIGGDYYGLYSIYDIWEKNINGHWQIMASKLDMRVDIQENRYSESDQYILTYPNPCSERLTIQLSESLLDILMVNIYNSTGTKIRTFDVLTENILIWDLKSENMNLVPPGIYFIEVRTSNNSFIKKVVVAN